MIQFIVRGSLAFVVGAFLGPYLPQGVSGILIMFTIGFIIGVIPWPLSKS